MVYRNKKKGKRQPIKKLLPPKNIINLLKKIYSTPSHEGSFSEPQKLQKILKKTYKKKASLKSIQEWMSTLRSYTYHRRVKYSFPSNPIIVGRIDGQWESDLMFLPDLAEFNDGYKIALVCVDVISRYAWVEPMKTKHGEATAQAMSNIFKRSTPRKPEALHTDAGTEFFNTHFKKLMISKNIEHFITSTDSRQKAAIAERFNRTLKGKIYKFLDDRPYSSRYIDVLQDLVDSYNNTVHSTIKMKPSDVNTDSAGQALWNQYERFWTDEKDAKVSSLKKKKLSKPKLPRTNFVYRGTKHYGLNKKRNNEKALKPGDLVRIAGKKHPFFKEYKGNWTEEIFKVSKTLKKHPNFVYEIQEYDGIEPITGVFYREELQKVKKSLDQEWQIEKILKTEKRRGVVMHFVKWFGFSERFNSWVSKDAIIHKT